MSSADLNGFPLRRIADVCDVVNGGTPKTGERSFWDGSHQWITPAEMGKRASPYVEATERTLTGKGLEELAGKLVPPKSVILSSRAPIGHLAINTVPMAFNQGCKGLVPKKELNYKFLYHYLYSIRDDLDAMGTGATFRELSGGRLKEVFVPVPPLPEQQRIVGILDEAFAGIATAKANAEKNLRNARELFQSNLASAFEIRDGNEVRLEELATHIADGDHLPPPKSATGIPFITISDIVKRTRTIDFSNTFMVSADYFLKLKDHRRPRIGDVLYTVTGATLGIPVHVKEQRDFCFQRHIGLIRPNEDTDSAWLSYALLSPQSFRQATVRSTGAAQKTVSLAVLRKMTVPRMPLADQRRLAARLDNLSAETQCLASLYQQKLAALDALKKSLLHQAFSGKLHAKTSVRMPSVEARPPLRLSGISPNELHAAILIKSHELHRRLGNLQEFGHVKAEKITHLLEWHLRLDLERKPVKDAAGPNDFPHFHKMAYRAEKAGWFRFSKKVGSSYVFELLPDKGKVLVRAATVLGTLEDKIDALLTWLLPFTWREGELLATVYAGWNNLLLDGVQPTDEEIVYESRENWHPDKLRIERSEFFWAIGRLRDAKIVPTGWGKRVDAKTG